MTKILKILPFLRILTGISDLKSQFLFIPRDIKDMIEILDWRRNTFGTTFEYEGSPFMNNEFINGDIYYNNQFVFKAIPLRYDIYNGEMQYRYKDNIIAFSPKPRINMIIINSDTFVINVLKPFEKDSLGFFRLIAEGRLSVLAHSQVMFIEGKPAGALMDRPVLPRFVRKPDEYYAVVGSATPQKIKSIKKLIEMIGDKEDKLAEYIKSEKINSVTPDDLVKLARYYNSF